MRQEKMQNVPPDELGDIVSGFADDGATSIDCRRQGDGNWTVTATFPD
jgi:hypothetical protein